MRDLSGLPAIVTGGASGLGLATARALTGAGMKVVILDLSDERPNETASEVGAIGFGCDVADERSVLAAIEAAEAAHGIARVVVNCAGMPGSLRLVGREGPVAMDQFARVIAVNLLGTVSVMTKAVARMREAEPLGPDGERGIVVNTASITAYEGQIGQGAYVASKGGVAALTLQAAREFASYGVRVVAIAPGLFRTPMAQDVPAAAAEAILSDAIFPRRFGEPGDFADLVLAVCRNPMLNGEVIRLDAGVRLRAR